MCARASSSHCPSNDIGHTTNVAPHFGYSCPVALADIDGIDVVADAVTAVGVCCAGSVDVDAINETRAVLDEEYRRWTFDTRGFTGPASSSSSEPDGEGCCFRSDAFCEAEKDLLRVFGGTRDGSMIISSSSLSLILVESLSYVNAFLAARMRVGRELTGFAVTASPEVASIDEAVVATSEHVEVMAADIVASEVLVVAVDFLVAFAFALGRKEIGSFASVVVVATAGVGFRPAKKSGVGVRLVIKASA